VVSTSSESDGFAASASGFDVSNGDYDGSDIVFLLPVFVSEMGGGIPSFSACLCFEVFVVSSTSSFSSVSIIDPVDCYVPSSFHRLDYQLN
jgi:hypothetical protein